MKLLLPRRAALIAICFSNCSLCLTAGGKISAQEEAEPQAAAQSAPADPFTLPNAAPGGGGFSGSRGYGFAGGGFADGSGSPALQFMILEGESDAGNARMKVRTASRVKRFTYQLSSFKPQEATPANSGMGGYGGHGYGGNMAMTSGFGGRGDGSEMMGGYGAMAMGGSNAMQTPHQLSIDIHAYIFDNDQENNRIKIELLTSPPPGAAKGQNGHMYAEGIEGGMGMMGMPEIPQYVRLASLVSPPNGPPKQYQLTPAEFTIVASTIKQKIWKTDAVRQLNDRQGNAADIEQLLKQLLTEEYETQLARQEMEVDIIQQRVTQLKEEIARRHNAKERVIDVQLGRIVLEAQGLLGK